MTNQAHVAGFGGRGEFMDAAVRLRAPNQQKRKKARAQVNLPADFQILGHHEFLPCSLADIGSGGLALITRSSLYIGDKLKVRFKIAESPFEGQCVVVRVVGKAVGVQFENLSPADEDRLQDFIHRVFLERERKKP